MKTIDLSGITTDFIWTADSVPFPVETFKTGFVLQFSSETVIYFP